MGKVPIGVANLAKKYYKPVVALAGSVTKEAGNGNTCGIDAFFPIVRECITLEKRWKRDCKGESGIDCRAGHQIVESSSKR